MISINKAEKEAIRERFPNVFIIRTMKHRSKRHHYFCEEDRRVIRFLNERRGLVDNKTQKGGGNYANRKNGKRVAS